METVGDLITGANLSIGLPGYGVGAFSGPPIGDWTWGLIGRFMINSSPQIWASAGLFPTSINSVTGDSNREMLTGFQWYTNYIPPGSGNSAAFFDMTGSYAYLNFTYANGYDYFSMTSLGDLAVRSIGLNGVG